MEWFEHTHEHEHDEVCEPTTAALAASAVLRLSVRLKKRIGMPHCRLLSDADQALRLAVELLFSPELGERALYPCDEVLILSPNGRKIADTVAACGGSPVCVAVPESSTDLRPILESSLSPATRAVIVENISNCQENLRTVRNFCNKYDLWMIERADISPNAQCEIDGKLYCIGGVGDWSFFDLSPLRIRGGALLIRDKLLNALATERLSVFSPFEDTVAAQALLWLDGATEEKVR